MKPEHEQFMLDHVKQMGFFCIIDRLKDNFPSLSHNEACNIYREFEAKHANDAPVRQAQSQMKAVGKKIADAVEKTLKEKFDAEGDSVR